MSWWGYGKDGRELWAVDLDIMGLVFLIAFGAGFLVVNLIEHPTMLSFAPFGFMAVGLVGVLVAKLSLLRQGIWVSWGPKQMGKPYARLYVAGYALIGIGLLLLLMVARVVEQLGSVR